MLAQLTRAADANKQRGAESGLPHAPGARSTPHRMADEDVHFSKRLRGLQKMKLHVGARARLRRFTISRLIHGIAIKTSGSERLAQTKHHLFRAAVSMSQERNGMRTRRGRENSKGRCVCS